MLGDHGDQPQRWNVFTFITTFFSNDFQNFPKQFYVDSILFIEILCSLNVTKAWQNLECRNCLEAVKMRICEHWNYARLEAYSVRKASGCYFEKISFVRNFCVDTMQCEIWRNVSCWLGVIELFRKTEFCLYCIISLLALFALWHF